jgi:hypothetical protein
MERERGIKKLGGKAYVDSWQWEEAISEIAQRPKSSSLVQVASGQLRRAVHRYVVERYDDQEHFERLLDKFERAMQIAIDQTDEAPTSR